MFVIARIVIVGLIAVAGLAYPSLAAAELGGTVASVSTDSVRMNGAHAQHAMGRYTRHDITRGNGGMVHEFTNPAGQVFAVTWHGPGKPDLRTLLGPYFRALQGAGGSPGRMMHSLRHAPAVNQADLKIETAGHMGWFRGIAYVPSLAPPGFPLSDLDPTP